MRRITLGRTGAKVPVVSVGTWGHGGARRVRRHPVGWSGQDDEAARAALVRAWELGLDHWDTADAYGAGHSERLIGTLWDRVARDDIFLAGKVGWERGSAEHGYEPEQMRRQIEGSLRRLRVESLDLLYLHHCDFGDSDRYLDSAIELVRGLRTAGKVRWLGLSDWDPAKVARYALRLDPDVVQIRRSLLTESYSTSGLPAWVERSRAGVCFFSPLEHGLLLGTLEQPPEFERGDHRTRRREFRDVDLLAQLRRCRDTVTAHLSDYPQPVLEALIAPLLADSPTACALVGMRRPEHVEAAAQVGAELAPETIDWLRGIYAGVSSP